MMSDDDILKGFSQIGVGDILRDVQGGASVGAAVDDHLKLGQTVMAALGDLPARHLTEGGLDALKAAGVVFGAVEGLFQKATLPEGWKITPTFHPMWSELRDAKGYVRARIFYSSAIWDREAHIRVQPRFSVRREVNDKDENQFRYAVFDGERAIWSTPWAAFLDYKKDPTSEEVKAHEAARAAMEASATAFVTAGWPNWQDITAYWDI